ncbi:TonB-dependent siderophore receptor [Sphingomonas sp.]|uniref:TonB-dependent receptor plug domain-containing protein n=1 Tax=Sphingomonas sp. TaxID=28214 RepID=UPI0025CC302A|nr:TonB-dependent receptor [Sphingomonas sp.]
MQTANAPPTPEQVADIVVTGTAIRGVAPVGSATVNVGRAQLLETGVRDAAAIVSALPQGSGLGTTLTNSGGRAAGVNLRGLGNNATLVLFDGHRVVPQGAVTQIADPNQIPFAALERVEVVTDGASAIYGSDAVAGVVNYILRKDFNGLELTFRDEATRYNRWTAEGVGGTSWGSGGIMLGFSVERGTSFRRGEVDYLRQDLRSFGGNDNRFIGTSVYAGATPAILVGNAVYGTPATSGAVPTAAQVRALAGNPSLADLSDYQNFYAARRRYSVLVRARQEIGDNIEITYTGLGNRRETHSDASDQGFNNIALTVTSASPYYVPGLSTTGANQSVVYNLALNNPNLKLSQDSYSKSMNHTVDVRVDLPSQFRLSAYGTFGEDKDCGACQNQVNTVWAANIAQLQPGFNPYLQGPQALASLLTERVRQIATYKLWDGVAKIDGPLFHLPGGDVRIAAGTEFTKSTYHLLYYASLRLDQQRVVKRDASSDRMVKSGFAELFVPIVGPDNSRPFVQKLDLSAAVRYDHYSDFGNTTNPKIGVTWKPDTSLTFRGSWGTAFRAPTLVEGNPQSVLIYNRIYVANNAGDPAIPVTNAATGQSAVLQRVGNSLGLGPEKAHVWSLGGDYDVSFVKGLKIGVTYYNVVYRDRIEALPNPTLILNSPQNLALFRDYFITAPQPSTCVNGNVSTYNPLYAAYYAEQGANFIATTINDCSLVGIIRGGTRNLGTVKQDGLDFTVNYRRPTSFGQINASATFSKVLHLKKSLVQGGDFFDALDTYGYQVSARGRGNIGFSSGGFTANSYVNYTGSYLNNATITVNGTKLPSTTIPAWITYDAQFSYRFGDDTSFWGLKGVRFALGIQNLTNNRAPVVLSGSNAFDAANANPFGRIWTFEVSKKF